jgi:hypothetical protein
MGFNNSIITLEEMVRRRFRSEEIVSISASSGGGVGGPKSTRKDGSVGIPGWIPCRKNKNGRGWTELKIDDRCHCFSRLCRRDEVGTPLRETDTRSVVSVWGIGDQV